MGWARCLRGSGGRPCDFPEKNMRTAHSSVPQGAVREGRDSPHPHCAIHRLFVSALSALFYWHANYFQTNDPIAVPSPLHRFFNHRNTKSPKGKCLEERAP